MTLQSNIQQLENSFPPKNQRQDTNLGIVDFNLGRAFLEIEYSGTYRINSKVARPAPYSLGT